MIPGALLIYNLPLTPTAYTMKDHISSFALGDELSTYFLNTELGFPKHLRGVEFSVIILHYSLFGTDAYKIDDRLLEYLQDSKRSFKVAFFQDEYRYCQKRFRFINETNIDCIYTLLDERYHQSIYKDRTTAQDIIQTIPGYVSDHLINITQKHTKGFGKRTIDIGYRSRELEFYMGQGAQEKVAIAKETLSRSRKSKLQLDISVDERDRIYGEAWFNFLGNCKSVIGTEGGVSLFDLDDKARLQCSEILKIEPNISFDEIWHRILKEKDHNVSYRTITPRNFEAIGTSTAQILFEGEYSGVLVPWKHYLPLKKDFSNFDEIIKILQDGHMLESINSNAYRDIIDSGDYSYKCFIRGFEKFLLDRDLIRSLKPVERAQAEKAVWGDWKGRLLRSTVLDRRFFFNWALYFKRYFWNYKFRHILHRA